MLKIREIKAKSLGWKKKLDYEKENYEKENYEKG